MLSTRPLLATLALTTLCGLSLPALASTAAATQTLPSGVVVTHLTAGSGAQPTAASVVKVHYEGKLKDGTVFDSSYKRGSPAVFPLNRVIPCWTEGVQTLKVGGKATLQCPAKTAYGTSGAGGVIPPNADLTFTVELISIER
ncbi:MAG: FKBP-type peptidyl-prolyl cis-trans isomerase [Aquabacterium sp.]|jgi:FKBP-type peptidyl-prolyl cis-trans isomerase FkpA|uniref:FKBP-type peptidyl-prolyl cis-trans isomerase n=1 Tax=Aquabacterium sp. TaxID=1872578 RepID=UPI003BAEF929